MSLKTVGLLKSSPLRKAKLITKAQREDTGMAIKLNQMKLTNFQGIRNLELNFDGLNKSIRGDNGTGKTTIINAYYYLLTDKPS
ncbi:MAG: AAA family ATPase, partial [Thomasclavelia sp.]|uniref:AAA family ATPase n=1 Tax=Thomasclavelia sp. TaxID=3025757 RepID=UPI0039A2E71C